MLSRAVLVALTVATIPAGVLAQTPKTQLSTGQFITPLAAVDASFMALDPGLADHPNYRAGEAVKTALSPDGKTLLVMTSGYNNLNYSSGSNAGNLEPSASNEYVFVYNVAGTGETKPVLRQVVTVPDTYVGLAFTPEGASFYVSGGVNDQVLHYGFLNGAWSLAGSVALGHSAGLGFEQSPSAAGLAASANGRLVVNANIYNDSISVVDTAASKVLADYDLRPYNTTPSSGNGVAGGETPFGVAVKGNSTVYVASVRDRQIVVLDISKVLTGGAPALVARIPVQGNPNSLLLSNDAAQSRLFVAEDNSDTVGVIDTASNQKIEEIDAAAPPGLLTGERYTGAAPNGLALSPDGNTLFVTEGGSNALAVISVGSGQAHVVKGLGRQGGIPIRSLSAATASGCMW
jgi:YVTN family beta-propeller protein